MKTQPGPRLVECISTSVTSITSNVLLAIGLPSQTGGTFLCLDGQIHHDTHAVPMGNYVIGVGNYVIANPSDLGNYKIADSCGPSGGALAVLPGTLRAARPGPCGGAQG